MRYHFRDLNPESALELDLIVKRSMQTVLDTIPEFKNDPELVRQTFPNFTFEQMKAMFKNTIGDPNHRMLVVEDYDKNICGHSIFSTKVDNDNQKYGFCYSRYIQPDHRRKGLAQKLLDMAEVWWKKQGVKYVIASTHVTNIKTKNLFLKNGFELKEPKKSSYLQMYELRKDL